MNDWGKSVLEQYELEVTAVRRGRGALLCDTADGVWLLTPCGASEKHLEAENRILLQLTEQGITGVDRYVRNRDGTYLSEDADHKRYVLKTWWNGTECNPEKQEDCLAAMKALARTHQGLCHCTLQEGERETLFQGQSLQEELVKHNREIRHVWNYIRARKQKNEFERLVMESVGDMYELALETSRRLEQTSYQKLYEQVYERGILCHGNFHYHNVVLVSGNAMLTNFQKLTCQVQLRDIYHFMRKALEKKNWDLTAARQMLAAYESVSPLSEEEREVLRVLFAYPEKYWKQLNYYLNSKKNWIPEKNTEKLLQCIRQEKMRRTLVQKF